MCRVWQVEHSERLLLVLFSLAREIRQDRMVSPVTFRSCFMWAVRWCHTVRSPGTKCIERSPPWNCSSFHSSSMRVSVNHDRGVSWLIVCFMSSSSSSRVASEGKMGVSLQCLLPYINTYKCNTCTANLGRRDTLDAYHRLNSGQRHHNYTITAYWKDQLVLGSSLAGNTASIRGCGPLYCQIHSL